MVAEQSATIRWVANAKVMEMVSEEKLDRVWGSSGVKESVEVDLEREFACRTTFWVDGFDEKTARNMKFDEAMQKRTCAKFGQSEPSVGGPWKKIVYMDDERWFLAAEVQKVTEVEAEENIETNGVLRPVILEEKDELGQLIEELPQMEEVVENVVQGGHN